MPLSFTFNELLIGGVIIFVIMQLIAFMVLITRMPNKAMLLELIAKNTLSHEQTMLRQHDVDKSLEQIQQKLVVMQQHHSELQRETSHQIDRLIADFRMKLLRQMSDSQQRQEEKFSEFKYSVQQQLTDAILQLTNTLSEHRQQFNDTQVKSIELFSNQINTTSAQNRAELNKAVMQSAEQVGKTLQQLTQTTDARLKDISGQVEQRLADGFEKTTQTFHDIIKRLALIDDAQKKITELSANVVSLQEVLADKRSRGAFGEVQLTSLIRNVFPEQHFALQHTLSNGKIADCVLFLPKPTGNVVIDSKFPLESYRVMTDISLSEIERKSAERQFKIDIKKHISDIANKYLIEGETSDGAIMFIPAEAIFAEIHAHHTDLVDLANKQRIWMTSPTTLMAILTTARAVIKDEATRDQLHIIQQHLARLSGDFTRFRTRFNNLAKHIDQAAVDVKSIHTSADKIAEQFHRIEQVDLIDEPEFELPKPKLTTN